MKRIVPFQTVVEAVSNLCREAAVKLPSDVLDALRCSREKESKPLAKSFFDQYLENADIALNENMPLCQDTGFAVFFVEYGENVQVDGEGRSAAINAGVRDGYARYYLRKSIVEEPLFERKNTKDNTPAVIHFTPVPGDGIRIVLAPKGGGSENMSTLKMFKPSDGREAVVKFVVDSVKNAGGNPCPPVIVGVGIGGTFEMAAQIAKRALLRKAGSANPDSRYAELEAELLEKINQTGVGPQGLGGDITALAVHVEYFPCHIASLPVAVNINCHAARHAEVTL